MTRRALLLFAALMLLILPLQGGTRAHVEATLRFLADDQLEGRATPGRGLEIAARFIAEELRGGGWQPMYGGDYLQRYDLATYAASTAQSEVSIDGEALSDADFVLGPLAMAPTGRLEMPLLFAGFGIDAPEKQHNDFAALDVRGKGVVVLPGAPWKRRTSPFGFDRLIGKAISARNRGAALTLVIVPDVASQFDADSALVRSMAAGSVSYLGSPDAVTASGLGPILAIREGTFDRLMQQRHVNFSRLRRDPAAHLGEALGTLQLALRAEPVNSRSANVVALLPGSDPQFASEYLLLTAHYDHLGIDTLTTRGDRIFNGADDNASGTAAVLEIARQLAQKPHRRSVIVLLDSGEERGLFGSAFFAAHSPVPLSSIVLDLNLDMVGRAHGRFQAITNGSDDLFNEVSVAAVHHSLHVLPDQQPDWRVLNLSDDYQFARHGIPSVEFFTGFHRDYHGVGDEAEKIDYDGLAAITETIGDVARHYADGAVRPQPHRPSWFPQVP